MFFSKRQKGQGLVEFALILPVLLMILLGIIEMGFIFQAYLEVQHAAREAARFAVTYQPNRTFRLSDGAVCDGSEDKWGEICFDTEDPPEYLDRRVRYIKWYAHDSAAGLRKEELGLTETDFAAHQFDAAFFGVRVTGYDGENWVLDYPGLQGLPIEVEITYNVELLDPIYQVIIPRGYVQLHGRATMINEGMSSAAGGIPPVAPTKTPVEFPTFTPSPTGNTPTPSVTPTGTGTPVPTGTSTPTPTPSQTPNYAYITVSDYEASAGDIIYVYLHVHDAGNYDVWWIADYVAPGAPNTERIITTNVSVDASGENVSAISFTIPNDTEGTYHIESYHAGTTTPIVGVSAPLAVVPPPPDLVVQEVNLPTGGIQPNEPVVLDLTIANLQASSVSDYFDIDIYIDPEGGPRQGLPGIRKQWLAEIGPYGTTTATVVITDNLSFWSGGLHDVYAQVDTSNRVAEFVETNNITGPFQVDAGCLSTPEDHFTGGEELTWAFADIGTTGGSRNVASDELVMTTRGESISSGNNSFSYLYQEVSGDFDVTLRVIDPVDYSGSWAKIGLMARQNTYANSPYVMIGRVNNSGDEIQWITRPDEGGVATGHYDGETTLPVWVRLVRQGTNFYAYYSTNGSTWTEMGGSPFELEMADPILLGIAAAAYDGGDPHSGIVDDYVACMAGVGSPYPPPPGLKLCEYPILLRDPGRGSFEDSDYDDWWDYGTETGAAVRLSAENHTHPGNYSFAINAETNPFNFIVYHPWLEQSIRIPSGLTSDQLLSAVVSFWTMVKEGAGASSSSLPSIVHAPTPTPAAVSDAFYGDSSDSVSDRGLAAYADEAGDGLLFASSPLRLWSDSDSFRYTYRSEINDDKESKDSDVSYDMTAGLVLLDPGVDPTVQEEIVLAPLAQMTTTIYSFNMDTDPGWTTTGEWAWGQPTGGNGDHGQPDPTSGHTGNNVYGYNLSGGYANNLSERHLTTTALDCTICTNTTLSFWRWLNVERSLYDHAYVWVSNDVTTWTNVWANPDTTIEDTAWSQQTFDISAIADNQPTVYISWTMGTTDGGWTYSGWNIDDVEIWSAATGAPPTLNYSAEPGYNGTDGIDPELGDTSTTFTYKVVYTDPDNDPPAYIRVVIDSTPYAMILDTSAAGSLHDGNYTNGEQYTLAATLPAGTHSYYFNTSDGVYNIRLPETVALPGPTVAAAPASIGDRVWNDLDGDGVQDGGEIGINGVALTLSLGGATVDTATTAGGGAYLFSGLIIGPGTFEGTVRDEFSSASYNNNDGTQSWEGAWIDSQDGDPNANLIRVTGGRLRLQGVNGTDPTVSREVDLDAAGAISATLSFDLDTSGNLESNDELNVSISSDGINFDILETFSDDGDVGFKTYDITSYISADTTVRFQIPQYTTGADEYFYIDDLQVEFSIGSYIVTVDDSNFGPTGALEGYGPTNAPADRSPRSVTLSAGEDRLDIDFGYRMSSIGDYVWDDANDDGSQVGETGIDGVTLTLSLDGVPVDTATTAGGGIYHFSDLVVPPTNAETVRDEFSSVSYSRNDGTANWAGNWVESDDNSAPGSGDIQITGGELRICDHDNVGGSYPSLARSVDLSRATEATLSFDYHTAGDLEGTGQYADIVVVQMSNTGSDPWVTLDTFVDTVSGSAEYDISAYISTTTTIRFRISNEDGYLGGDEYFYVDNVQIAYAEQARWTVTVDDSNFDTGGPLDGYAASVGAPVRSPLTVTLTQGEDYLNADFGYSPNDPPYQPVNITPAAGAMVDTPNPEFTWSAYNDVDGDPQSHFQVQVRLSSGTYGDANSRDSGEVASTASSYTSGDWRLLNADYCWHVRVRDDRGTWSNYSIETCFSLFRPPDAFYMQILDSSGTITLTEPILIVNEEDIKDEWLLSDSMPFRIDFVPYLEAAGYDLIDFAGSEVVLKFWAPNNGSAHTKFYVDDIQCEVCSTNPIPTPEAGRGILEGNLRVRRGTGTPVQMPGVPVWLYAESGEFFITTSIHDSTYHFYNVPPGTYTLYSEVWIGSGADRQLFTFVDTVTVDITQSPQTFNITLQP